MVSGLINVPTLPPLHDLWQIDILNSAEFLQFLFYVAQHSSKRVWGSFEGIAIKIGKLISN